MQNSEDRKLAVIIDGSSFIFRAFFACPPMKAPDGRSVGAVHGFCTMLISQLNKHHDSELFCVAMDCGHHTFRLDMYPEYKANRDAVPDDLRQQLPLMSEVCGAFGLPTISQKGFEADDVIATYSNELAKKGYKVRIIGVDKDLFQLMDENIEIYNPVTNKVITQKDVEDKFGVTPSQMIDFQALVGDKADNIPGVPGIGPVTAAKLLQCYGSLENLYEHIHEILPFRVREKLEMHKKMAELSKKLVTLSKEVQIFDLFPSVQRNYNQEKADAFLASMGFDSLKKRMHGTTMYAKACAALQP